MIGGNITGTIQVKTTVKNAIGESMQTWVNVFSHKGWLDLQTGEKAYRNFLAPIEESTHVFLCDYHSGIYGLSGQDTRMVIKGITFDVLLIDNPMELDEQLEIYLRKVG
jgi:hypothetical protein